MNEQFGAIPIRAQSDKRLTAGDFRVMTTIAYFDRFGRNGYGCIVDSRRIAELSGVDYSHIARHTGRLQLFGYLRVECSPGDRRKRIYSLIYDEDRAETADGRNDLATPESGPAMPVSTSADVGRSTKAEIGDILLEKLANAGEGEAEIVATSNQQWPESKRDSDTKRSYEVESKKSCEANLRDPAKPRAKPIHDNSRPDEPRKALARQGDPVAARFESISSKSRPPNRKAPVRQPDWESWARWLVTSRSIDKKTAWLWIMEEIDRLKETHGIGAEDAGWMLHRKLKREEGVNV